MAEQSRTHKNQSVHRNQKPATGRPGASEQIHPALALQRARVAHNTLTRADVMTLQRSIGNRATGLLLQAKLKLGPAGDRYEQEADQVAHKVVRSLIGPARPPVDREREDPGAVSAVPANRYASSSPDSQSNGKSSPWHGFVAQKVQREAVDDEFAQAKPLAASISSVQRSERSLPAQVFVAPKVQRAGEEKEEVDQGTPTHGMEGGDVEAGVAQAIQRASGGGRGLEPKTRSEMEGAFGASFGGVRVHTGNSAHILNRSLNARAFTTGQDIFFANGEYSPESTNGKELLAHELTHTVQQSGGALQRRSLLSGVQGHPQNTIQRAGPTFKPNNAPDKVTKVGDLAAIAHGTGATFTGGTGFLSTVGALDSASSAVETIAAVGEVLAFAGIAFSIFGIAENAVRGRDAKIRLGCFTKAYLSLSENDPMVPYLKAAAKQQQWEKNRRWVRVAVNTAILGLSIAALAVGTATTGGAILAGIGAALAIGKAAETLWNWRKKKKAEANQRKSAEDVLNGLLFPERAEGVRQLLGSLGIPEINYLDVKARTPEYEETVRQLAPTMGRAEIAQKEAMQELAAEILANSNQEADQIIAQENSQQLAMA